MKELVETGYIKKETWAPYLKDLFQKKVWTDINRKSKSNY